MPPRMAVNSSSVKGTPLRLWRAISTNRRLLGRDTLLRGSGLISMKRGFDRAAISRANALRSLILFV
jgi:hypothetical protein